MCVCSSIKETLVGAKNGYDVYMVDHSRIQSLYGELHEDNEANDGNDAIKRKCMHLPIKRALINGLSDRHYSISWSSLSGEFDADDSSNSKTFRSLVGDKKPGNNKDLLNATDKDIMVGGRKLSI